MSNEWLLFRWDLGRFPESNRPALPPFTFRRADGDEGTAILQVVSSALMMERAWSNSRGPREETLEKQCAAALDSKLPPAVVVQHGTRIIGASIMSLDEGADIQLLTGPCILHEYRSRGLGSALLHDSLELMKQAGLPAATAIARVNSTAAKFVYPKFGGTPEPFSMPKLAA